ncbi:MAG TPA: RNA-binding cell elongation regulator Jag/EloR [Bacillota bacterium]|nr:RNA-binding cell elongation regulator Jag/EloR [Bacillota bacterium]HPP85437.1 RNA-binding cell elongation regulator Jag/EloR [Bacillota bacterium]
MTKEIVATGKTVDDAVLAGAAALGKPVDKVKFEVLEEGRKGILGIGACDAKVRVYIENTPANIAVDFLETLLKNMDIQAQVNIESEDEEGALISVNGENLGLLIGRHGDVLDAVQYLATLAANKDRSTFYRITIDIENYREKRAETLRALARRMSEKVLKYKRSFALEPMNAYERRIIHTECQNIAGVTTYSIGDGADRKIVIAPEGKNKK